MRLNATARRRWLGILVLLAAIVMLVLGQTVLQNRLPGLAFVAYWFVCLGLTVAAMVIAMVDARAMRRQTRQQARDLLQDTLDQIQAEAKRKPRNPGNSQQN